MASRKQQRHDRRLRWGDGWVEERETASGEKRWMARWPEKKSNGKTWYPGKTFTIDGEADAFLAKRNTARSPAGLTLTNLIDEFLERAADRLTDRTIQTYRYRTVKMISPSIGTKRIIDLKTIDIQRWVDGLFKEAFAPATVRGAFAIVSGALREAMVLGVIERNLAQGVRTPTLLAPTVTWWTIDQARRVLSETADDPLVGALYLVALTTGMRPGELRALLWKDVDLDRGRIHVRRTISFDEHGSPYIVERTKGKRSRLVAIAPTVVEKLRWHLRRQIERRLRAEDWQSHDLVFDRGNGQIFNEHSLRHRHFEVCALSDVPVIRLHDLRHTSASLELESGTLSKIVAERLGHQSTGMTDRYGHVSTELQTGASHALAERLLVTENTTTSTEEVPEIA